MMQHLVLDFRQIRDMQDFYHHFAALLVLDEGFGANLDALWDVITGQIALPLQMKLCHLHQHADAQQFSALVTTLRAAEQETQGEFRLLIE